MDRSATEFTENAKGLTRNPLGIIALFISFIYGVACLVLSFSINNLQGSAERLPLIWFVIIFPLVVLGLFVYLVICHHEKLYAPGDYKDENNFLNTFIGNKDISSDLEGVKEKIKSLKTEKDAERLDDSINNIAKEIEKIKLKSEEIPINNLWWLNHWHSNCASIVGEKMIFTGTYAPKGKDGSHIDINNILEIGKSYEISCFAKSAKNTTGMFQLWCHDETGVKPYGVNVSTEYKTPEVEGETFKVIFKAENNKNIRIHLQYMPGRGAIEVSNVRISEMKL